MEDIVIEYLKYRWDMYKLYKTYRKHVKDFKNKQKNQEDKTEDVLERELNEYQAGKTDLINRIENTKSDWIEDIARKLDVPIPTYGDQAMWHRIFPYGQALTQKGRAHVRQAIRKERREIWEPFLRYLTILTGLGGVIIGIISMLKD